jgi:Domain of unknown function (DUF4190)/Septum formation
MSMPPDQTPPPPPPPPPGPVAYSPYPPAPGMHAQAYPPAPGMPVNPGMPAFGVAPQGPKRAGLAVASMVLGIVGIFACFFFVPALLAFIFGLIAAGKIKKSEGMVTGKGMARAGWILGLVGMLTGVGFYVAAATGKFDNGKKSAFDLKVGDCVNSSNLSSDTAIRDVPVKKCSVLHDGEVYAVGKLDPGKSRPYPGSDTAKNEAEGRCVTDFKGYVGADLDSSEFSVHYLVTNEAGWRTTRGAFLCVLEADGPSLTGSMRGSNR